MNLKLDEQSVRIRISYQEAKALLENNSLEQDLSLFSGRIKIDLFSDDRLEGIMLQLDQPNNFLVNIAASEVQKIIRALDAGERKSENLEVNVVYKAAEKNSKPIQVSFEVDRFKGPRH